MAILLGYYNRWLFNQSNYKKNDHLLYGHVESMYISYIIKLFSF